VAGAKNAALTATAIVAGRHPELLAPLQAFRAAQTQAVLDNADPRTPPKA
jgi:5-(carboxyamino)imidazole ribonucleotide mutase